MFAKNFGTVCTVIGMVATMQLSAIAQTRWKAYNGLQLCAVRVKHTEVSRGEVVHATKQRKNIQAVPHRFVEYHFEHGAKEFWIPESYLICTNKKSLTLTESRNLVDR